MPTLATYLTTYHPHVHRAAELVALLLADPGTVRGEDAPSLIVTLTTLKGLLQIAEDIEPELRQMRPQPFDLVKETR